MSRATKTAYHPNYVSPPGETLQETLEMIGLSQAELAERTGRPKKTINEIVQGKTVITSETAWQLEVVLGVPATFWLTREARYRAWLAQQDEGVRLKQEVGCLKELPINEMMRYGWIEKSNNKLQQVKAVLEFFGVVSLDKIPLVEDVAFRRSEAFATNPWALAAWLRKGELDARNISCNVYDRNVFLQALHKIRTLTKEEPYEFVPKLTRLCADAGVTVVFVRELSKTAVSGSTRWISQNRPLIQLSLRHKTDDMIWFTFFHEAGHVYHEHAKREVLLEDQFKESLDHREIAANKFAMELLIPSDNLNSFVAKAKLTEENIRQFAIKMSISPGIVVGRLQHAAKLGWHEFQALKKRFSWETWPSVK